MDKSVITRFCSLFFLEPTNQQTFQSIEKFALKIVTGIPRALPISPSQITFICHKHLGLHSSQTWCFISTAAPRLTTQGGAGVRPRVSVRVFSPSAVNCHSVRENTERTNKKYADILIQSKDISSLILISMHRNESNASMQQDCATAGIM